MIRTSLSKFVNHDGPLEQNFEKEGAFMAVYCRGNDIMDKLDPPLVLLQMRFDGRLGFAGGKIEKGESPLEAAQREFQEEFGCKEVFNANHNKIEFISSHIIQTSSNKLIRTYLYAKEFTKDEIIKMERMVLFAPHYGIEVFGVIRCPLFVTSKGDGLPTFLKNQFAGSAFEEFVHFLSKQQLFDRNDLKNVIEKAGLNWKDVVQDNTCLL